MAGEVPTTITALDKTLELRRISDQISGLKVFKERAESDARTCVNAADAAKKRAEEMEVQVDRMVKVMMAAAKETTEFLVHCQTVIQSSEEPMNQVLELTRKITERVEEAGKAIQVLETKGSEIHQVIVSETENLDRKNRDLAIYHARLKKHFEEHLPDQKLII